MYRARDLVRLRRLLLACASPLAFESGEDWLASMLPLAQELVGGVGTSAAVLDQAQQPVLFLHNHDPFVIEEYQREWMPIDPGPELLMKHGITTWNREVLWATDPAALPAFLRSPVWHDYYLRHGVCEGVGVVTPISGGRVAYIDVASPRLGHPGFGDWGLRLFRALEAPFRHSARLVLDLPRGAAGLAIAVDAMPTPALAYSLRGRLIHANRAGAMLLDHPVQGDAIAAAAVGLAVRFGVAARPSARRELHGPPDAMVHGQSLSASLVRAGVFGPDPIVLVTAIPVEGSATVSRPNAALARLTERQQQVARLVAAGLSDGEIGERLRCARRTVRAHVADCLVRTGASNRSALAALVGRDGDGGTDQSST